MHRSGGKLSTSVETFYGFTNHFNPGVGRSRGNADASREDEHLRQPKYRPDIDGLRAIAVLLVVVSHAFPFSLKGGFIGVDIFFVISGFLISTIIFDNLTRGTFSFGEFYYRRIRRIFPALLLVLVASYALGWIALFADEFRQLGKHTAGGAGFVANFVLLKESGYFDNSASTKPLLHLWTLGVEEQFYIVWPLLLWLAWKPRLNLLAVTVVVAAISFYLTVSKVRGEPVTVFYSPQTRFWELMAGSILAYLTLYRPSAVGNVARAFSQRLTSMVHASLAKVDETKLRDILSFLGMALIVIGLVTISPKRLFPGWWALLPVAGTVLVISAGAHAWFNKTILSNRILVWVGLISYPLYLWHWPLLSFARILEGDLPAPGMRITLVATSVALAWATFKFVELPIRRGTYRGAKAPALFVLMLVVGCVGYATYKLNGLPSRSWVKHNAEVNAEFVGPMWKYTKNDICLNRYPFEEAAGYPWWFCMASKDEKPTLLILGNSYANGAYAGLSGNEGFSHHSILSIGTCQPGQWELDKSEPTPNSPCSGYRRSHQQEFIDKLIVTSGSIKYVIMDGLLKAVTADYIAAIKRRIDFIEKQNIKVIVFVPHVRLGYDIRNCFARPFKEVRSCELDIQERKRINEGFKPLVDQLAQTNPNVLIFDQNDLFCTNDKCSMVHNGMPLLRDEFYHLSEYGSIELARIFKTWASRHAPDLLQ